MPVIQEDEPQHAFGGVSGVKESGGAELDQDHLKQEAADFRARYRSFVLHFKQVVADGRTEYVYRKALTENLSNGRQYLEVDFDDLASYDKPLALRLKGAPLTYLPIFEEAARDVAETEGSFREGSRHDVQVQIFWRQGNPVEIRQMMTGNHKISTLIVVTGIVVRTASVQPKVVLASLQCMDCKNEVMTAVPVGQFHPQLPKQCQAGSGRAGGDKCRSLPYVVRPTKSHFVDTQRIKLQETREGMPPGEIPRHIDITLDRELVNKVTPGQRVVIVAINQIYHDVVKEKSRKAAGIRKRYLRAVGIMRMASCSPGQKLYQSVHANSSSHVREFVASWDPRQEKMFEELKKRPNLFSEMANSLAPAIFGHDDIKRAVICQLFGGTTKVGHKTRLRGDMNVLLVGDPSTAKSQILKCAHQAAPIGVYTSGKGSSAAGLTAAVVQDKSRRGSAFYLEGGSMVLADGGIVCIDEFDKMREQDAVAIHEAMEQQTISVTKAGISCVLNARTSVLAAANPSLGVYDPMKSNEEQMDFKASVLSRFDLIFKVLDPADSQKDRKIARHVFQMHAGQRARTETVAGAISTDVLKAYINYCRATCTPKLTPEAGDALADFFVDSRKRSFQQQREKDCGVEKTAIQLTTRQLESLIRITESLAKMRGSKGAEVHDAQEAIRLLKVSTVSAIDTGMIEFANSEQEHDIVQLQEEIDRLLPAGEPVSTARVVGLLSGGRFRSSLVERTLFIMSRRGDIQYKSKKKYVIRKR
eukprot:TRINITY_DN6035_c0_g1_i2.p1 TRINITY_DN6035_c0_g1~~TRINITY_DN6035_c0_g1_i2.p1  ORF type:complete len:776 (+),score=192.86 TRINITY_DN6035_c0_g1_i2:56-2329(+)